MALKECANDIEGVIEQIRVSETLNELKKKESTGNIDGVREQIGVSESQTVKELKILRAISRTLPLYESRLTLLEIAFQRGNVCYMMFPWADGGNLYEFWYRKDPPTESRLVLSWIRREIAGLLGALVLLHNLNCCHGDLKPDNILVFAESADSGDKFGWRLEIADFGIARIHELATNSRDQDTKPVSGAPRYEPPEANKNYCNSFGPWSRRYDVWSMGCIFLEFIVWISQGKDQLEKFNRKLGDRQVEKFWKFDSKKNCLVIHDVVVNQIKLTKRDIEDKIKEMNQMKRETPEEYNSDQERLHRYLLYVLRLVETRMLVIETTNNENDTKNCRATTELLFMDFFFYEMIDAMITWKHAALKFQKYHKDGGKNIIN
jgi:serine/threonine protein kinase